MFWECACFSPVRPDERCCAWPAVWSHLTAGTSAGWWELCRGRHAHINEIIWSAVEACGSSLLSSVCIFIKVDNGNRRGGNLSTPNQGCSQALTEENKTHERYQKKLLTSSNTSEHKNTLKEDKHIYPFNLAHFFLSSLISWYAIITTRRRGSVSFRELSWLWAWLEEFVFWWDTVWWGHYMLKCYPIVCWPGWKQGHQDGFCFLQRLIIQSQWCNTFPQQQAQWLGKEIGFVLQKQYIFTNSLGEAYIFYFYFQI